MHKRMHCQASGNSIPASLIHVSRDAINVATDDEKRRGPIYSTRARLQRATKQVETPTDP